LVGDVADGGDGFDESVECDVCVNDAVVGRPRVILDFLDEEDVRSFEEVNDVLCDCWDVLGGGSHVLNLWRVSECGSCTG